jgi:hypothetical protein
MKIIATWPYMYEMFTSPLPPPKPHPVPKCEVFSWYVDPYSFLKTKIVYFVFFSSSFFSFSFFSKYLWSNSISLNIVIQSKMPYHFDLLTYLLSCFSVLSKSCPKHFIMTSLYGKIFCHPLLLKDNWLGQRSEWRLSELNFFSHYNAAVIIHKFKKKTARHTYSNYLPNKNKSKQIEDD